MPWARSSSSTASIYNIGIGVDDKNPDNYSVNLNQAGLGMPDRDYYLSNDEAIVKTREAYRKYLADMMTLAGIGRRGSARRPRAGAGNRDRQSRPGTAPTAATKTRSTIPCRLRP